MATSHPILSFFVVNEERVPFAEVSFGNLGWTKSSPQCELPLPESSSPLPSSTASGGSNKTATLRICRFHSWKFCQLNLPSPRIVYHLVDSFCVNGFLRLPQHSSRNLRAHRHRAHLPDNLFFYKELIKSYVYSRDVFSSFSYVIQMLRSSLCLESLSSHLMSLTSHQRHPADASTRQICPTGTTTHPSNSGISSVC